MITQLIVNILIMKGRKSLKRMDKNSEHGMEVNNNLLMKIIRDNKDTEYGKKYNFANIKNIEDYKKNVPFSDYDTYAPYIERMTNKNEKNLITCYDVIHYAESSGTIGVQKLIPVTKPSMKIYEDYTITRCSALADEYYRNKHAKISKCKGLNTLECEVRYTPSGVTRGAVSGGGARQYKALFPFYLTSPNPVLFPKCEMSLIYMKARFALEDKNMSFMFSVFMTNLVDIMTYIKNNWKMIVHDIEFGEVDPSIGDSKTLEDIMPYIKKNKERADELKAIFEQGFDEPIIKKIWPKLSFVSSIGNGGFATYTEKFRKYLGEDVPIDFSIYGASEGLFAACRQINKPEFVLLPDSCFYEFLPVDGGDAEDTLTLDQLEVGKEYEIIVTNQCGFYRYKIRDSIKVLGYYNTLPLITFCRRMNQVVNICAEKTTEEHLDETMKRMSERFNINIADYCFYLDDFDDPSRYVLVIEPDKELENVDNETYSKALDEILSEVNKEYGMLRGRGSIGAPLVLFQQVGTHAVWREMKIYKGASSNQVKPVRILDAPIKQNFFLKLVEPNQPEVKRIKSK